MFAMNALTVISTDLLTPLGAYLRLRQGGRASFLLESVEKGRLGRHSFVGCGSRLVSFEEAEACGQPVVGYLGYEHRHGRPTVPVLVAEVADDRLAAGLGLLERDEPRAAADERVAAEPALLDGLEQEACAAALAQPEVGPEGVSRSVEMTVSAFMANKKTLRLEGLRAERVVGLGQIRRRSRSARAARPSPRCAVRESSPAG